MAPRQLACREYLSTDLRDQSAGKCVSGFSSPPVSPNSEKEKRNGVFSAPTARIQQWPQRAARERSTDYL